MNHPQRLRLLFIQITLLSLAVAGTGIGAVGYAAHQKHTARLTEEVKRRATAITAAAQDTPDEATILQAVKQELTQNPLPPELGSVLIGRQNGEQTKLLLNLPRDLGASRQALIQAAQGQTGTLTTLNSIAAYDNIEELDWGIVVQTPMQTFTRPYLEAGLIATLAAVLAGAIGTLIYRQVSRSAVDKLHQSEQRHRQIIESAAEGVITIDNQAVVETFNPAAERLFGYSAKQVLGQTINHLLITLTEGPVEATLFGPSTEPAPLNQSLQIQKVSASPLSNTSSTRREVMGKRQDGTIFPIELAVSRLEQTAAKRFLLLVRDISDRKHFEDSLRKRNDELELRVEERTHQLTHLNEELLHEIAERNNAEETLQSTEKRFRTLFNQAEVGIIQTTKTGQFVRANPRFLELTGYTEEQLKEQTFQDITHPDDLGHVVSQFRQLVTNELPELVVEQRYLRADGSIVWVHMSGSVVRDLVGEVEYFMAVVANISDRIVTQNQLMGAESTLQSLFDSTPHMMGIIELLDNDWRYLSVNRATSEWFHRSPIEVQNQLASALGVSEEVRQTWLDRGWESGHRGSPVQFTYADIWAPATGEGAAEWETRWLAATIVPIPSRQGAHSHANPQFTYTLADITAERSQAAQLQQVQNQLLTVTQELTARRQEMTQLAELNEFLQASHAREDAFSAIAELVPPLFADCSGAVYVLRDTGNLEAITHWGEHFNSELIFASTKSWAVRRGCTHWVDAEHPRLLSHHIQRTTEAIEALSIPMLAQGQLQGLLYLTSPVPGLISASKRDFAQAVAEQIGASLTNVIFSIAKPTDPLHDLLTGLFNRRYFEEALEREVHSAARQSRAFTIVLIDIDHFRSYNHTHGHEAGDAALKALGWFVQQTLQNHEIAARYGGEEIAVLLPDCPRDEVFQRVEHFLVGVRQLASDDYDRHFEPITVSMGIAFFPENGMTWKALIEGAEIALSRAKVEGRDRFCTVQ